MHTTPRHTEPRKIILDVDTGIDDALAILFACHSPELELLACGSVVGNVEAELAAANTLRVLESADVDVPVAIGASEYLHSPMRLAKWVHGDDGLGNTNLPEPKGNLSDEHAVDQMIRLAKEHPGQVTLVAVGPLTNVALALRKEPRFADLIAEVIVMGGTVGTPGNATPMGEANFAHDPEAAAIVLEAPWKVTVIGLNVTEKTTMDDALRADFLAADTRAGQLAYDISGHYLDLYESLGAGRAASLHDPLAVAVAADPTLVKTVETWATVELTGQHTRGMFVYDLRSFAPDPEKPVHVAVDVDVERFMEMARVRIPGRSGG